MKNSGLLSSNGGFVKSSNVGTSAPQNTAAGSGSRPVKSKYPLASGAAADPYTQGRAPSKDPSYLK